MTAAIIMGLAGALAVAVWELRRRAAVAKAQEAEDRAQANADRAQVAILRVAQLEKVIDAKKREIERIEADLAALDPITAHDRAQRLLLDPWGGDHPASVASALRDQPAPSVGAGGNVPPRR